jgi:hypothetical protein
MSGFPTGDIMKDCWFRCGCQLEALSLHDSISAKNNLHIGAMKVWEMSMEKLSHSDRQIAWINTDDLIANDEPGSVYIPNRYGFGFYLRKGE